MSTKIGFSCSFCIFYRVFDTNLPKTCLLFPTDKAPDSSDIAYDQNCVYGKFSDNRSGRRLAESDSVKEESVHEERCAICSSHRYAYQQQASPTIRDRIISGAKDRTDGEHNDIAGKMTVRSCPI